MTSIYVETSVVSYLRERQSAQLVTAARQLITRRWWERRNQFELVTSQYVLDEAGRGDAELAAQRLRALEGMPLLATPIEVSDIASMLLSRAVLPNKARLDALHIATAAYHEVDYLLTWNCTHIANARSVPKVNAILAELDLAPPLICTPDEFLDDDDKI